MEAKMKIGNTVLLTGKIVETIQNINGFRYKVEVEGTKETCFTYVVVDEKNAILHEV